MARKVGNHTRVYKRLPRARDRAWQSMRILRTFTLPDLVSTADIQPDNAKKYVIGLTNAGYVRCIREKDNGRKGGYAVYRLARDTGPHAPRLQADGRTYDTNTHRVYDGGIQQ